MSACLPLVYFTLSLSLTHTHTHTINLNHRGRGWVGCRWWEKKGKLLYWYRNMRDPVTLSEEVYEWFPMWKKKRRRKEKKKIRAVLSLLINSQQVCQTVTAYWSTDKGRLCGRGLVFSSSVVKICLFFKASLATVKSKTTAPRPHRSLHLTIRSPKYTDTEDNPFRFIGI